MSALIRRFNRCMAAGLTAAVLVAPAFALDTVKFMAPGSVGGGYDQTARVLGKAMVEANTAKAVTFENKGGIVPAQFNYLDHQGREHQLDYQVQGVNC
ncbi:DUF2790 domain-containing protein, partial [Pseudomonas sp. B1(2018)]|uniref:DUF2790 domain-containing protein n=1 Tax=Pseudomonas sp. B1(2018) TaxID=2233856 RepID=UPI0021149304